MLVVGDVQTHQLWVDLQTNQPPPNWLVRMKSSVFDEATLVGAGDDLRALLVALSMNPHLGIKARTRG